MEVVFLYITVCFTPPSLEPFDLWSCHSHTKPRVVFFYVWYKKLDDGAYTLLLKF